jgi:hypothetical protein
MLDAFWNVYTWLECQKTGPLPPQHLVLAVQSNRGAGAVLFI